MASTHPCCGGCQSSQVTYTGDSTHGYLMCPDSPSRSPERHSEAENAEHEEHCLVSRYIRLTCTEYSIRDLQAGPTLDALARQIGCMLGRALHEWQNGLDRPLTSERCLAGESR